MTTELTAEASATVESLTERLADVWAELEERLAEVPILRRLEEGTVTIDDRPGGGASITVTWPVHEP